MTQRIMLLGDSRRAKRSSDKVKRAEVFKAMPLSDAQLTWAIGHNLQWVLSIVKPESEVQS